MGGGTPYKYHLTDLLTWAEKALDAIFIEWTREGHRHI